MNCPIQSSRKSRLSKNSHHTAESGLTESQAIQLNSEPQVVLTKCHLDSERQIGALFPLNLHPKIQLRRCDSETYPLQDGKIENQRIKSARYDFNCKSGWRQSCISDILSKRSHRKHILVRRSLDAYSIRESKLRRSMMVQLLDEPEVLLVKTSLQEDDLGRTRTVPSGLLLSEKTVDGKATSTDNHATSVTRLSSKKDLDREEKPKIRISNHEDVFFDKNKSSPHSFAGVQKRLKFGREGKENVGMDYTKLMKSMDIRPFGQRNSAMEVNKKPTPCTPVNRIPSNELQQLRSTMRLKVEKEMRKRIEEESKRKEQRREDGNKKKQENLKAFQNEIRMKREMKMSKAAARRREAEEKKLARMKEKVRQLKRKQLKLRRLDEIQGEVDGVIRKSLDIKEDEDMVIGTDSKGRWTMLSNYEARSNLEPISPFTMTEHGGSAFLAHDLYSDTKLWKQTLGSKKAHWSKKGVREKLLSIQYKVSPDLVENYFIFPEKIDLDGLFGIHSEFLVSQV